MFECKTCKFIKEELDQLRKEFDQALAFERSRVKDLTDKLISVTNPQALTYLNQQENKNPDEYFGNGNDELILYNDLGQKVMMTEENFKKVYLDTKTELDKDRH